MQQDASCFVGPSTGEQEQSYSEGGHRNKHLTEGDLSNLWEVPVLLTLSEEWEQVQDGLLSIQWSSATGWRLTLPLHNIKGNFS